MAQGERLGRYTLIEQIAIGGMAEIWLARMGGVEGFEKLVVIKRIKDHLAKEPSFVRMFLNEARLAAQLNHPNICQIYDLGKLNQSYFIAMEYLFGRDLSEITPKSEREGIPFPLEYAIKILLHVCEGLYYAHGKTDPFGEPLHIVHRDISPQNIFVSFDGNVKILDFGIAKAANQYEKTQEGTLKGKLSYMSPEQILGQPYDGRSDLFGLGVVFYELVTGYKLFTGDNELAVLKSIVDVPVYPPSYFNDKIPEELDQIILKALEKDPADRFQNAWEMQQELNQLMSQFEFNPSNLHLSNFLKQLFADEIEREVRYLKERLVEVVKRGADIEEDRIDDSLSQDELDFLLEEAISIDNLVTTDKQSEEKGEKQGSTDTQPDLDALDLDAPDALDDDDTLSPSVPKGNAHKPQDRDDFSDDDDTLHPEDPLAPQYVLDPEYDPAMLSAMPRHIPSRPFRDTYHFALPSNDEHNDTEDIALEKVERFLDTTNLPQSPIEHQDEQGFDENEDPLLDVNQILFTMRFRIQEYEQLKKIAARRSIPLDQLLREMIHRAMQHYQDEEDLNESS